MQPSKNVYKYPAMLPNPYEADGIFESGTFLKEFEYHYSGLAVRHKLCLLCFAIFPENAVVKKSLLRYWWQGERLMPETEKKEKCSVSKLLKDFVKMGFIEPVTKKKIPQITSYKMHPMIRCLIISLAQKANFFNFNPNGYPNKDFFRSKKICLVKTEGPSWWCKDVPEELDPNAKRNEQGKSRDLDEKKRLEKEKREVKVELEKERVKYMENLQTVFNVSEKFPHLFEELLSKMKNIGVLYMGRWEPTAERHIMEKEKEEFLAGLENLRRLRFFSLQGISGITKLPKSLGRLYNLRILDLRACHNLEALPREVGSLKKLTHLDLSECFWIDVIPKQLSKLSNLKVLKGFVINKISPCTLQNLTKLPNLEKLSNYVKDDDFSLDDKTATFFSKFGKLQKLKIAWQKPTTGKYKTKIRSDKKIQARKSRARKAIGKLKKRMTRCYALFSQKKKKAEESTKNH